MRIFNKDNDVINFLSAQSSRALGKKDIFCTYDLNKYTNFTMMYSFGSRGPIKADVYIEQIKRRKYYENNK